jgi:hypothetical protein
MTTPQSAYGQDLRAALSVVVTVFSGPRELARCLEALEGQKNAVPLEIVVPYDDALGGAEQLRERFPAVRFLRLPGRRTPAELRAAAILTAGAPIVALLEDHCTPANDWCSRVLDAHRSQHAAAGGCIEKGFPAGGTGDTALNWAMYLTDYSRYMPPMPAGPAHGLSDCNVSYKRSALEKVRSLWSEEFHENVVNGALAEAGESLWFEPGIVVRQQRPLDARRALRDRYAFGRLFGSTRVAGAALQIRLVRAAAALVMPPVLVARVAGNLLQRRRHRGQLIRCLPWLVVVCTAWMVGEAVGYLLATPDSSLSVAGRSRGTERLDAASAGSAGAGAHQ